MVRKIQNGEYLKRYDNMKAAERQAYEDRVGEWLRTGGRRLTEIVNAQEARFRNAVQLGPEWNDADCQAFEEGARLMSALVAVCDTWLPDLLYTMAARRSVRQMAKCLSGVKAGMKKPDAAGGKPAEPPVEQRPKNPGQYTVKPGSFSVSRVPQTTVTEKRQDNPAPVRPKHIDQYVHLLPQKTQERAAKVRGVLRGLDDAREKMRLLSDSPQVKQDELAAWARKVAAIDKEVKDIYTELDAEWEKLVKSGRVTVDDLGNAHVSDAPEGGSEGAAAETELSTEQKRRRRELRKWLSDTRRGNGSTRQTHVGKWNEKFKEYQELEGAAALKDEKILEAARHYGIELVKSEK